MLESKHCTKALTSGFPTVAIATDNFLLIPPEYEELNLSLSDSLSPTSASFEAEAIATCSFGIPLMVA